MLRRQQLSVGHHAKIIGTLYFLPKRDDVHESFVGGGLRPAAEVYLHRPREKDFGNAVDLGGAEAAGVFPGKSSGR
jgi:hypothetical protein